MGWWERVTRWEDAHRFAIDATGTALLLLVGVPASVRLMYTQTGTATAILFATALIVPLAWRRARPTASAAAIYLVCLAQVIFGVEVLFPADLVVFIALYSVTVHGPRWAHRVAAAGAIVGALLAALMVMGVYQGLAPVAAAWMFASSIALAVWAFGLVRRSRHESLTALVDRARRLETERDQQHQIATAAERSRIAREMHDIVAHSLSVIIAQADGGRYAAQADPDAASRALGTIAETGRAALGDMRRLLGVLRTPDESPASPSSVGSPTVTPQPAEQDLEALVEQVRASGLRVSLVRMGTARRLPPGAGLTVYRICQEALTNVLKHAGPDPTVTVLVQWLSAGLVLDVSDDGRGAAADSDGLGQGLLGMRERAAMFGGTVTVGPRPGGGFRVRAQVPLPPAAPADPSVADASPVPSPAI